MNVVISQDGSDSGVSSAIAGFASSFGSQGNTVTHVAHKQKSGENGYQLLSQHYGFGLMEAFGVGEDIGRVIILEEDIEVAVDFFSYFEAMSPMLDDPGEWRQRA